eukprot:jgi/Orpsp1_1/1176224/evm.model.c7180000056858.1
MPKISDKDFVLTEEDRQFMLKNKKAAREKLKLKLQQKKKQKKNNEEEEIIIIDDDEPTPKKESNAQPNSIKDIIDSAIIDNGLAEVDTKNKKNRKRKIIYCDYNLSEIVDTKGGFLIEKKDDDNEKEKEKKIKQPRPINLELDKNPKCQECESLDIDYNYFDNFKISVCRNCRTKMPEKYSLLTKTECKEDYLLTD